MWCIKVPFLAWVQRKRNCTGNIGYLFSKCNKCVWRQGMWFLFLYPKPVIYNLGPELFMRWLRITSLISLIQTQRLLKINLNCLGILKRSPLVKKKKIESRHWLHEQVVKLPNMCWIICRYSNNPQGGLMPNSWVVCMAGDLLHMGLTLHSSNSTISVLLHNFMP